MTQPALSFYNGTPFTANNVVDPVDTYVCPGGQTTFALTNNTTSTLGSTIQAGLIEYYQFNGGFTLIPSASFNLAVAPPVGTQMVAPGIQQLVVSAFDQPIVPGVASPLVQSVPVWLIDPTTINNFRYYNLPAYPGLQISIVQLISGSTAQPSWVQLASANASGNAMTYGATGAPLYYPPLDMFGTLVSTTSAGLNNLVYLNQVAGTIGGNQTQFWPGQYVSVNIGTGTQEIWHVIAVNYSTNVLTIDPSGATYTHLAGEPVYACGWKFWLQVTIPANANNNTPVNLYNLAISRLGAIRARP